MANTPINAMTATFGGGDQTAIKMNVTTDSSNALSKLIDLQIGGVSKFKVTKEGFVNAVSYTGSYSGSSFIKNSTTLGTNCYLVFVDGTGGQKTLRIDSTGIYYNPSTNNLIVQGSVDIAGDYDTSNSSTILFSSPTSINLGANATDISIGNSSAGSFTKFESKQVRASSFTGSFTGSFSGSKIIFNKLTASNAKISNRIISNTVSGSLGNFTKISGSSLRIIKNVVATSYTGSISGSLGNFTTITGLKSLSVNRITASISGSLGKFTKLTASNARVFGRVVATSFTGSLSGSKIFGTKITASTLKVLSGIDLTRITASISGSRGYFSILSASNAKFDTAYGNFSGSIKGNFANFSSANIDDLSVNNLQADSFTGSISGSRALFNQLSGSYGKIRDILIVGGTYWYVPTGGSAGVAGTGLGRIIATAITGSISGSRARFTKLTGSNARILGRVVATSFTGSISGSRCNFTRISGSNATISGRVIAKSFTGSFSGSLAYLLNISGGNLTVTGRVIATRFTGSISGSSGKITYLTASKLFVNNNITARSITASISGSKAVFGSLTLNRITGSISGSSGKITYLTASKLTVLKNIKATSLTGSFSGSVFVNPNTENSNLYLTFVRNATKSNTLYTDTGILYNPSSNYLNVDNIQLNGVIDTTADPVQLFSSPTVIDLLENSVQLRVGKNATTIGIGGINTNTRFSGSITSSIARFVRLTASNARVSNRVIANSFSGSISGSSALINQLSGSYGKIREELIVGGTYWYVPTGGSAGVAGTGVGRIVGTQITGSNIRSSNNLNVKNLVEITGSLKIKKQITGSGDLFMSGAGAITGYVGIMIGGTKYKLPLYAWS